MVMASHGPTSVCARFHEAVELIGARWTGALLQVLLRGTVRYADLRAAVPAISDRMLCERLRALEEAGLVTRHVNAEPPVPGRVRADRQGPGAQSGAQGDCVLGREMGGGHTARAGAETPPGALSGQLKRRAPR